MSVTRLACATVLFLSGLGVGAFWCPFRSSPQKVDSGAVSDPQPEREKFVAKMKEIYGEECGEFVRQFEDMTIRLNKYPIVVSASPDGRFVIRLFGSGELIASDLHAQKGEAPEGVGSSLLLFLQWPDVFLRFRAVY